MDTNKIMSKVGKGNGRKFIGTAIASILSGSILTAMVYKLKKQHINEHDNHNQDCKIVDESNDTMERFHDIENVD